MKYNPEKIEKKWQKAWDKSGIYSADDKSDKPKWYSLVEFPYPSGAGLHVGHIRSNTALDIVSRKRRMQGYNVLYPMGWDAFGLPTENYAIKTGISPQVATKKNTDTFRKQLKALGFSFDWKREIDTTDPEYYKWTQWMFLQFFKHGLAYKARAEINWCPKDKIGLANEEVENGKCERCGGLVEKRLKEQWMLKMTAYAEKLLGGLKGLDFIPEVVTSQENWIGKKEGIEITYPVEGAQDSITVFTTRPDTNFGATFIVLAPDHALVEKITTADRLSEVRAYAKAALQKNEQERIAEGRKKTGAFTGRYAVNHLTGRRMPIWVSDFVLSSFGTGAVVGVPGHDLRDFEFAREFNIEIIRVVIGPDKDTNPITHPDQVQEESGTMTNSDFLNGLDINTATSRMMDHLEAKGWGKRVTNYRLRDWVFSRQRYWGEPIPLIHCDGCGWVPVPDKDLPVKLPKVEKYQPTDTGESPLSKVETWVNVKCPTCKGAAKRETDTMPNWAGSSWYFLRYLDPKNKKHFADKETMKDWLPVDWYNGGMEHATRHLLYARFWNQFLHDIGEVPASEPFKKRTAHGIILAADGKKMSKSLGNVVNPDELIKEFGADALRLYEMFIGPFSQMVAWDPRGILGTERFLQRVWRAGEQAIERDFATTDPKIERFLHKTIKKVGEDIESMGYNTAISAMMMFINDASAEDAQVSKADFEKFLSILAPFAPHITEELWSMLGNKESIHIAPWPEFNPQLLVDETFELVIQINGKVRATATAPSGISEADARQLALANPDAKKWVTGDIKKTIFVPNKLINLIV